MQILVDGREEGTDAFLVAEFAGHAVEELTEMIPKLSSEKQELVLKITKRIAEGKAVLSF